MSRITVRATLAVLASCIPAIAAAQWWNPQSPIPPARWQAEASSFVYTKHVRSQAVVAIGQAFAAGDFAKLDRMHDEFLEMHARGGNGSRMLGSFTDHFSDFFGFGRDFGRDPAQRAAWFEAWRQAAPGSRLRAMVEAATWTSAGWTARGSGFASEVSPEGLQAFRGHLDRAARILLEAGPAAKESPLWYAQALGVAGSRGEPAQVLERIYQEGATRFPRFSPIYGYRLTFLLPKWGGDYEKVDRLVRDAVMRTQAAEGTSLYAELYSGVHVEQPGDFFRETRATWKLMKHAFEDKAALGTAEPDQYATFACIARDRETTRRLLAELGPKANLGLDKPGFTTEACQEFVQEGR